MSYEDDIMFRLSVFDSPDNAQQLESLATSVEATMARISGSIRGVGATMDQVSGRVRQEENRGRLEGSSFQEATSAGSSVQTEREFALALEQQNRIRREGLEIQERQTASAREYKSLMEASVEASRVPASGGELQSELDRRLNLFRESGGQASGAQAMKEEFAAITAGFVQMRLEMGASEGELEQFGMAAVKMAEEYSGKIDAVVAEAEDRMRVEAQKRELSKMEDWRPLTPEQMAVNAWTDEPREVATTESVAERRARQEARIREAYGDRNADPVDEQRERDRAALAERMAIRNGEFMGPVRPVGSSNRDAPERREIPTPPIDEMQIYLETLAEEAEAIGNIEDRIKELNTVGFGEIVSDASQLTEGISKLAQGLAFLGLANSDAAETVGESGAAFIDALLKIKGYGNALTGAAKAGQNIFEITGKVVRGLTDNRRAQELLNERQERGARAAALLAEAMDRMEREADQSVEGQEQLARSLREMEQMAERAGLSLEDLRREVRRLKSEGDVDINVRVHETHESEGSGGGRSSRGRRGGFVGGLIRSTAGMFVGNAVSEAGGGSIGSMIADQLTEKFVEGATSKSGSIISKAGAKLLGAGAMVAASAYAAYELGMMSFDAVSGGGSFRQGSRSQKFFGGIGESNIGGSVDRYLGLDTPAAALNRSNEELSAMMLRSQAFQSVGSAFSGSGLGYSRIQRDRELSDLQFSANVAGAGEGLPESQKLLAQEMMKAARYAEQYQEAMAGAENEIENVTLSQQEQLRERERAIKLSQQIEGSLQSQAMAIKAIAAEQRAANEEQIKGLKTQQTEWKKIGDASREALQSGAERFGQLSDKEQKQAIAAIGQARKAKEEAERSGSAFTLSRELESTLARVGDSETESLVSESRRNRGRAAGFDRFFGRDERASIQQSDAKIRASQGEVSRLEGLNAGISSREKSQVDSLNSRAKQQQANTQSQQAILIDNQFTLKLEQDTNQIREAVIAAMQKEFPKQKELIEKLVADIAKAEYDKFNSTANSQRKNSRAGNRR